MRKLRSIAAMLALVGLLATPALAHGSCCGARRMVSNSVCPVQNCTLSGLHNHGKRIYSAHYHGDGHGYHAYCELEDCAIAEYHAHDGVYCFGHTANDGHSYHHPSSRQP